MLTTNLKLADKYNYLSEKFTKAYHFLRTEDLEALPVGITEIDGNEVFANVQEYTTMPWEECAFEAHNRYFDIQYVVYGREMFGYPESRAIDTKNFPLVWLNCCSRNGSRGYPSYALE